MMAGMMDPFAEEFSDQLSCTIQILDVPEHLVDLVELHVEHTKYGGGEFERIEYDHSHRILTVTFLDAKGLRNTICCFFLFWFPLNVSLVYN